MKIVTAAMVLLAIGSSSYAQTSRNGFDIQTVSARADLISGGDVLVQITVPATLAKERLAVTIAGRDVSGEFKLAPGRIEGLSSHPNTFVGLINGLPLGKTEIGAGAKGEKPAATLALINHPVTGPVMSGRHQ